MSVRDCLLAILTLGPQYGLQLHAELTTRTPHRVATNVGQIYSTLERLVRDGKVETGGSTADGLPLYRLTDSGRGDIQLWLNPSAVKRDTAWPDILDLVFMVRSLPDVDPDVALGCVTDAFAPEIPSRAQGDAKSRTAWLLAKAEQDFATCVREVVTQLREDLGSEGDHGWGLTGVRPKRGRRPLNPST